MVYHFKAILKRKHFFLLNMNQLFAYKTQVIQTIAFEENWLSLGFGSRLGLVLGLGDNFS